MTTDEQPREAPSMVLASASADPAALARLDALRAQASDYASQSRAAATLRAYRADWADFRSWCAAQGCAALPAPPETVALYLTDCADGDPATGRVPLKVATLTRRLSAIAQYHKLAGQTAPSQHELVRTVMKGIRRTKGVAQDQATAATTMILRTLLATLPGTLTGKRDRALLLVGFAGALRRSNLVALDVADLQFTDEGMILRLNRTKTDQEGAGTELGIVYGARVETCPVRSLKAWLGAAMITSGPVFRPMTKHDTVRDRRLTDQSVALIIKRAAAAAGLDPVDFSGHSLRSGLATSAARAGMNDREIAAQTGHRSMRVLQRYIRRGTIFADNVSGRVGL